MSNIILNTNGNLTGTGSLNPVPTSFGPVTGVLNLLLLDPEKSTTLLLLNIEGLTFNWENNVLTGASNIPLFNFTQYVNVGEIPGLLNGIESLGIPQIALPNYCLGKILVTKAIVVGGTFTITCVN